MCYSNKSEQLCDISSTTNASTIDNDIPYYKPFLVDNTIYSIDRIHIIFTIEESFFNEIMNHENLLIYYIPKATTKGITLCSHQYYQTYNIKFGSSLMTVKMILQLSSFTYLCSLEVNPNLCFCDKACIDTIAFLLSRSTSFHVRTLDVAIDIPLPRYLFRIQKDRRQKLTIQYSKTSSTEYCGKRNNPGHCKLYDKSDEMKLNHNWTRVEITYGNPLCIDFLIKINAQLPIIKVQTSNSILTETCEKLSSTDKVLITLFQKTQDREFKSTQLKRLDYKKQKRLKPIIFADEKDFIFNIDVIKAIINNIVSEIVPSHYKADNTEFVNTYFI